MAEEQGIVFEREPAKGMPVWLHALLLLGALPLLVPALLISRVQAKSWGRIPMAMLAWDAVVLLIAVVALPRLAPLWLLAGVCTGILAVRRSLELKTQHGIFLGYSNLVASLLMLAGVLSVFGLLSAVGARAVGQALQKDPMRLYDAYSVANHTVKPGQRVRIKEPALWEERVHLRKADGLWDWSDAGQGEGEVLATLVPLKDGFNKVWALLPGAPLEAPAFVEGRLRSGQELEVDGLIMNIVSRRYGGVLPDIQYVVGMGPYGEKPAEPEMPTGKPWGWAVLAAGLLVALLAIAQAVRE